MQSRVQAVRPHFGWINSLFTALAFAGVLVTLWFQRTELQLQREEMRLTRDELKSTREEHSRVAKAQERSENRLFLAAYMSALESLRQFSQWRMTADPARDKSATYPIVEGLIVQARVSQSLQKLVRDLEPKIRQIHPGLTPVTERGSNVWCLEQLLNVYLNVRVLIGTHKGRSDDSAVFKEAVNIARIQLERLKELKDYCGHSRNALIDPVLSNASDPTRALTMDLSDAAPAREARKQYFHDLQRTNSELLSAIMSMCFE